MNDYTLVVMKMIIIIKIDVMSDGEYLQNVYQKVVNITVTLPTPTSILFYLVQKRQLPFKLIQFQPAYIYVCMYCTHKWRLQVPALVRQQRAPCACSGLHTLALNTSLNSWQRLAKLLELSFLSCQVSPTVNSLTFARTGYSKMIGLIDCSSC